MLRLLFAAALAIAGTACQHVSPLQNRQPAAAAPESRRIFDGSILKPKADLVFANETKWGQFIEVNPGWLPLNERGEFLRCRMIARVPERTKSTLKAGTELVAVWIQSDGPMSNGEMLAFYERSEVDAAIAVENEVRLKFTMMCDYALTDDYIRLQNGLESTTPMSQMALSDDMLGKVGFDVTERAAIPPMKIQRLKYSPGDEKGPLKEIHL